MHGQKNIKLPVLLHTNNVMSYNLHKDNMPAKNLFIFQTQISVHCRNGVN